MALANYLCDWLRIRFSVSWFSVCVFTFALGVICDYLYEESKSILLPAIFHGAVNAIGTIPLVLCVPNTNFFRLLGPAPNGIIVGLPFLVVALVLMNDAKKLGN